MARDGEVTRVDLERERGQIPKAWEALDDVPNRRSKNRIASESEHNVGREGCAARVGVAVCVCRCQGEKNGRAFPGARGNPSRTSYQVK